MKGLKLKNLLSIMMAFMITVSTLLTSWDNIDTVNAVTSAKSRVQTYIGLAAGKAGNALPDIDSLTKQDMQFLGVYLSNYYVPFSTELGVDETEMIESQKQDMVTALCTGLNFNEEVANGLVENIIGLSRSNNKELKVKFSADSYGNLDNLVELPFFQLNYYTFVNLMSGTMGMTSDEFVRVINNGTDNIKKKSPVHNDEYKRSGIDGYTYVDGGYRNYIRYTPHIRITPDNYSSSFTTTMSERIAYNTGIMSLDYFSSTDKYNVSNRYLYAYIGYEDNAGNFVPVFDCSLKGRWTLSQQMFYHAILVNGDPYVYLSFFDLSEEDLSAVGASSLSDLGDNLEKLSAYSDKMHVDCYGNIIRMGYAHQTIIIPGCLNPYTWVPVGSDGTDNTKGGNSTRAVQKGNMIVPSIPFLALLDSNKAFQGFVDNTQGIDQPGNTELKILQKVSSNQSPIYSYLSSSEIIVGSPEYTTKNVLNVSTNILNNLDFVDGTNHICFPILGIANTNTRVGSYFLGHSVQTWKWSGSPWRVYRDSGKDGYDFGTNSHASIFGLDADYDATISAMKHLMETYESTGSIGRWSYWNADGLEKTFFLDDKPGPMSYNNGAEVILGCIIKENDRPLGEPTYYSTNMMFIDNLGAFGFDSSNSDIDYNAFNVVSYVDTESMTTPQSTFKIGNTDTSFFNNITSKGKVVTQYETSQESQVSLLFTYAVAGLYDDSAKAESVGKIGYRMNREGLPPIENGPLLISSTYADDLVNMTIRNWIYYILHPTQGMDYVKILIRNKLNAILVDWHNNMVGTTGIGITTGTTYYRTNYGYVTTPDLSEIQWTSTLLDLYNNLIPLLIVFVVVSMLLAYVTGVMSFQRAVLAVLAFSMFLLVPVNAINYIVETTNRFTNKIYGEKFTYWAVVQEETYGSLLDEAAGGESYSNYLRKLYSINEVNQGGESIVLKWQAPKKMASLMLSKEDNNLINSLSTNLNIGALVKGSYYSGEAYMDGDSQYMYRDYSDIANFSRFMYNSLFDQQKRGIASISNSNLPVINVVSDGSKISLYNSAHHPLYNDTDYRLDKYTSRSNIELRSYFKCLGSKVYADAVMSGKTKINNGLAIGDYVGINQDYFNVSLAYFNNTNSSNGNSSAYIDYIIENCHESQNDYNKTELQNNMSTYGWTEEDFNSLMAYGVLSESPFYFFSWGLYDDGMSTGSLAHGGYRNLLLSDSDGGYFYNMEGNGELKDYLNMRDLFCYVIPYLKAGNDVVVAWDEKYGIFIYDDMYTEEGHKEDYDIKGDGELEYKYWHNLNVARLYEIYTPWVDLMYDTSYAKPETINANGQKYYIEDPINPWSYPPERPMIFSESEMVDYGLNEGDLTKVERKILEFNRETEERMYELLNYYNFSDLSLNTAAAINATFAFNIIFSDNGVFSDNINLYPQSFEIKDFSYDAFLRFILSTTTGESMASTSDFYGDLVAKSSTTTALLLILLDILSQYAIPLAKIAFIMCIFISSIMVVLVTVFRVDPEFKFLPKLIKQVFTPMVIYLAITLAFAWIISMFMGVGNNAVTQSNTMEISMGDPNIVMLAMIVINILTVVLYAVNIVKLVKSIFENIKLVGSSTVGLVGGAVAMVGAGAVRMAQGTKGTISGGGGGSSEISGTPNEVGTGRESARASRRAANSGSVEDRAERGSYYDSGRSRLSERETAKNITESKTNERRTSEINNSIKQGTSKVVRSTTQGTAKVIDSTAGTTAKTIDGIGKINEAASNVAVAGLNKVEESLK